ncbi:ketosteroid isomerase-like protein [Pseudarthrobacter defluvii]|uniref:nuclear transport factor 2 family protein n=1 Tax=Pseudarthrobacter defluvii TaxID=410837 RepID=UPI002782D4BB|nr:nuclear transport factor 2 family protein [Pseudarthrobacter defluvii]MDQ0770313.1 ketosteroid isomerase-like protein [Pseudarthrobacter defluvii]
MSEREDFLQWVRTSLHDAEVALHNGDANPRRAIWSRIEPVSILGAFRNAYGLEEVEEIFRFLEDSFSNCTSWELEVQSCDVLGDMAYTAGIERISFRRDGNPTNLTLRATQIYRREDGQWKVAHRHADVVAG